MRMFFSSLVLDILLISIHDFNAGSSMWNHPLFSLRKHVFISHMFGVCAPLVSCVSLISLTCWYSAPQNNLSVCQFYTIFMISMPDHRCEIAHDLIPTFLALKTCFQWSYVRGMCTSALIWLVSWKNNRGF